MLLWKFLSLAIRLLTALAKGFFIAVAKSSFLKFPSPLGGEGQGEGVNQKKPLAMGILSPLPCGRGLMSIKIIHTASGPNGVKAERKR
jgi:hypothetical protein